MVYHGFELWDLESGNAVEGFPSEQEAMLAVIDAIVRHGRASVEHWALAETTDDGIADLGSGSRLIERALAMVLQAAEAAAS